MEITEIINDYWDIFNNHISKYHKLNSDFIEKFECELNWKFISHNKILDWNKEFLQKYADRFNWYTLALNSSISWSPDLISLFKRRLDWGCLIKNNNLPINDEFLMKYPKLKYFSSQNYFLTDELKEKYNLNLVDYNSSWVDTYFSEESIEDFVQNPNELKFSKQFYETICFPYIQSHGLEEIYTKKFNSNQKYFFLNPKTSDIDGLIPAFDFKRKDPFEKIEKHFEKYGSLEFEMSKDKEGPERIYDAMRVYVNSQFTNFLVSENLKNALLCLNLPEVKILPVSIKTKKIVINTQYFLLQFENDLLHKNLIYKDLYFKKIWLSFDKPNVVSEFIGEIKDYNDLEKKRQEFRDLENYKERDHLIFPESFPISSEFDLHTYSKICGWSEQRKLIVNEFSKIFLENNFPGQLEFQSAQLLKIKINEEKYNCKRAFESIKIFKNENFIFKNTNVEIDLIGKKERLLINDPKLKIEILPGDEFFETQKKLNIVIPEKFKIFYRKGRKEYFGYEILKISEFYIEDSFLSGYPETIKSLIFAENQLGDSLGLLLQKDSDYNLMSSFYEFLHEEGACVPFNQDENN